MSSKVSISPDRHIADMDMVLSLNKRQSQILGLSWSLIIIAPLHLTHGTSKQPNKRKDLGLHQLQAFLGAGLLHTSAFVVTRFARATASQSFQWWKPKCGCKHNNICHWWQYRQTSKETTSHRWHQGSTSYCSESIDHR